MQNYEILNFKVTELLYIFIKDLRKGLKLYKISKNETLDEIRPILAKTLLVSNGI